MKTRSLLTLCLLSSAITAGLPGAQAAVVFNEDFNEYVGSPATTLPMNGFNASTMWLNSTFTSTPPAGWTIQTVQDSGNIFGKGSSSNYLNVTNNSAAASTVLGSGKRATGGSAGGTSFYTQPFGSSGQFSFNFYQPVSTPSGSLIFRLETDLTNGNGNSAFAFGFDYSGSTIQLKNAGNTGVNLSGPAITSFSQGLVYSVDVVFNNNGTTLSYAGGTVAAQSYDIWVNSVLVGNDLVGTGASGVSVGENLTNFDMTLKGTSTQTFYFDDFVINNVASVPEPSAATLAVCGLLLFAICHRRKARVAPTV